jgi:glutathione synthase
MDRPDRLDLASDTSLALAAEGIRRGHALCWYEPHTLALSGGALTANVSAIELIDGVAVQQTAHKMRRDLRDQDVVLIRQDPPFDLAYLTTTYLLEHIQPDVLVLNDPAGIRNAPEKLLPLYFPDITPPTLITADRKAIEDYRKEYGDLVMKPLYGAGGNGVLFLSREDPNLKVLLQLESHGLEPLVIQPYLAEVTQGEKRVLVVDGDPVGAVIRQPAIGEIRSNINAGGRALPGELTERDREICARLKPALNEMGLMFAGLDVLGNHLIEINVTSPSMIPELKALTGTDATVPFWDAVERRFAE